MTLGRDFCVKIWGWRWVTKEMARTGVPDGPPHRTYQYVSGVEVKNIYLTIDEEFFRLRSDEGCTV